MTLAQVFVTAWNGVAHLQVRGEILCGATPAPTDRRKIDGDGGPYPRGDLTRGYGTNRENALAATKMFSLNLDRESYIRCQTCRVKLASVKTATK